MAGVYIKSMELPKDEYEHTEVWIYADGTVAIREGIKLIWGKFAIEVPDHGDLIERDAIAYKVCEEIPCSECQFNEYPYDSCVLQTNLEKLKVVIPADKGAKYEFNQQASSS